MEARNLVRAFFAVYVWSPSLSAHVAFPLGRYEGRGTGYHIPFVIKNTNPVLLRLQSYLTFIINIIIGLISKLGSHIMAEGFK